MDLSIPPDLSGSPEGDKVITKSLEGDEVCRVSDRVEDLTKSESWVSVAQDKKSLKKHEVEILKKDGMNTVEIIDEIIANSTPLWEDFVVGKFLDLAPHIVKVHKILNKI